jgi:hypothetical protein
MPVSQPITPVDNTIDIQGTETITAPTYEGDVTYQIPINQTTPDIKPIQDLPMAQEPLDIPTQDVGLAYTGDFDPADEGTVYSDEVNNALLPPEQQDPGFWETARDNFIKTGQDIGNFFQDLGGQGLDIAQLAGTTLLNLAGKALTGVPLLGTALSLIGGLPSKRSKANCIR